MNIKIERLKLRLTQKDLAVKIGVTPNTIVRWEANPDGIPGAALIAMADLFGCSTDYLLERSESHD